MRISDWSSDVCSSDLQQPEGAFGARRRLRRRREAGVEQRAIEPAPGAARPAAAGIERQQGIVGGVAQGKAAALPVRQRRLEAQHAADQRQRLAARRDALAQRSEEHTSELQSPMRTSYAVFSLKKKNNRDR